MFDQLVEVKAREGILLIANPNTEHFVIALDFAYGDIEYLWFDMKSLAEVVDLTWQDLQGEASWYSDCRLCALKDGYVAFFFDA